MRDYEELVRELRDPVHSLDCEFCNRKCCYPDGVSDDKCVIIQAADAIEDLIAALTASNEVIAKSRDKWISVEERLPEFNQKVLAWVKNKSPEARFNHDDIYIAELKDRTPEPDPEGKKNFWGIPGYDSEWTVWAWSYFSEPEVTHWMPLPEPPKGADNA